MSVAPEIARLAETALLVLPQTPQTAAPQETAAARLTLGTLARQLRIIAANPERWWGQVRFDRDRPIRISVEEHPSYQAWLLVLPPGHSGQSCDCDVVTMIAGEAIEGDHASAILRPGPLRVHGQRHWLRGQGAGYSISLHARASSGHHVPAPTAG